MKFSKYFTAFKSQTVEYTPASFEQKLAFVSFATEWMNK